MFAAFLITLAVVSSVISGMEGLLLSVQGAAIGYALVKVLELILPRTHSSYVDDNLLQAETDNYIIQSFLSDPSEEERESIQKYLERKATRERREEAMLLQRLAA